MSTNKQHNVDFLKKFTDDYLVIDELLVYTKNKFLSRIALEKNNEKEDSYITTWNSYKKESEKTGVFKMLKSKFKQFQFPVQKNISLQQEYRNATLKGLQIATMQLTTGLVLNNPNALQLKIYNSIAGKVPVLIVPDTADFNTIIQALSYKNEPVKIPQTMGAAFINGINNWDRIDRLKEEWQLSSPFGNWNLYFKEQIAPNPYMYKDKLIVLSTKPYSGVSANNLSISSRKWEEYSLAIRLEHECTHFFTLKNYGEMANNMHDELIADYMGISKVLGKYNKNWFLNFIGLENYPEYRKGARFENYLGAPPLSKKAFRITQFLVKEAANNLEKFDCHLGAYQSTQDRINRLVSICNLDLIDLASAKGVEQLLTIYENICQKQYANIY